MPDLEPRRGGLVRRRKDPAVDRRGKEMAADAFRRRWRRREGAQGLVGEASFLALPHIHASMRQPSSGGARGRVRKSSRPPLGRELASAKGRKGAAADLRGRGDGERRGLS
jgi:hypothetical protein